MAVTRAARLELKREDSAVFGASSDGKQWQFSAIDRNGQWIQSDPMPIGSKETVNTVFRNLAVIIYLAWKQQLTHVPGTTADPGASAPLVSILDFGINTPDSGQPLHKSERHV